jgi:uncharacterized protein with PQ loop repeat
MVVSQVFSYIGSSLSILINIPQVIKMARTKDVSGISLTTYVLVIITNACFMVRTIDIGEGSLTIANLMKLLTGALIIYFFFKYRNTTK